MQTVAEHAGVSRALVSLVMNNSPKVSDARRQAVLTAAAELGYRPNLHARNLAQQRTRTVGIVINDILNPFFAEVVYGLEAEADRNDYRVLILNAGRDADRERRAVETHLQLQVEALTLVGSLLEDEDLRRATGVVPTVVVAAGRDRQSVHTVTTSDIAGARLAVEHLMSLGHRDIVHLEGTGNRSAAGRVDGYERAMRSAGLEPRVLPGGDRSDSEASVHGLIESGSLPTAILAFNDLLAAGSLGTLERAGLRVPDDVSIIGFDNTYIASLGPIPLTAISQPAHRMGELALATAIEQIENGPTSPTTVELEPTLVVRASTAPPRKDH